MNPIQERKEEERQRRRQDILEAAKHQIEENGVEGTTLDLVAGRLRISRSLIYTYFPDRDGLLLAIVIEGLKALFLVFTRVPNPNLSGLDTITALGRAYIDFAYREQGYFRALTSFQTTEYDLQKKLETYSAYAELLQEVVLRSDQVNQLLAKAILSGHKDGSIKGGSKDSMKDALVLWSATSGLIQSAMVRGPIFEKQYGFSPDELLELGLIALRRGLE